VALTESPDKEKLQDYVLFLFQI